MTKARRPGILTILLLTVVIVILGFRLLSSDHASTSSREADFWLIYHADADREQRTKAVIRLLESENDVWIGANLTGVTLSGLDLQSANLQDATLNESLLVGTNLSGGSLYRTDLDAADLQNADFNMMPLQWRPV